MATHVFVPPVYPVGRPGRKKNNSTALWQRHGPDATRGYGESPVAVYLNATRGYATPRGATRGYGESPTPRGATRRHAMGPAAVYFNANGELPVSWDWVATTHILTLPSALNEAYRRTWGLS